MIYWLNQQLEFQCMEESWSADEWQDVMEMTARHTAALNEMLKKNAAFQAALKACTPTPEERAFADAITALKYGDPAPLGQYIQAHHPKLAPHVAAVMPGRGKWKRKKKPRNKPALFVHDLAKRIRELWKNEYKEQNKPEITHQEFAIEIYRRWWSDGVRVTEKQITAAIKPSGKHKNSRKKSRAK
jgi:hypothetical protein